jgi:hypothetical protein
MQLVANLAECSWWAERSREERAPRRELHD